MPPLDLTSLATQYKNGELDPTGFLQTIVNQLSGPDDHRVWIHRASSDEVQAQLIQAQKRQADGIAQPLLGVPFAVKDNIDVAGMPTTAACPKFAYVPQRSAAVVQRLCDAGAVVVGKTNLDQFATGLVGTRSAYGACHNAFNAEYISGGSSSGSAVAVAKGLVSFALGTDTAGSGRVPASFNNLIGLKPTHGLISCRGVVPACQSLDCVSVFALNCGDARTVLQIAEGFDPEDPYARRRGDIAGGGVSGMRLGVPKKEQLKFFGNAEAEVIYSAAVETARSIGASIVEIDYAPFAEAAAMLYAGPWLAERFIVARDLMSKDPEAILPVTRSILSNAPGLTAVQAFEALHRLAELKQAARAQMAAVDMLLLPTTGTIYTIAQVEADPFQLNINLGHYTNFVNLLDMCGVAVPAGFLKSGVPFGVTLIAPAGGDHGVLAMADRLHRATNAGAGIAKVTPPPYYAPSATDRVRVAVVGAHLSGMPLNYQLTDRGAHLIRAAKTAPVYRFFALPGTTPPKPGLVRAADGPGSSIDLEIWEMPSAHYGSFVAMIPPPLGIGTLDLDDGTKVQGFLCESSAINGATDISHLGGWRAYMKSKKA